MKRPRPGAIAGTMLLIMTVCLLAVLAWQAAARPFAAARLVERHQAMSAKLDGMMICMLRVEMAHERFLSGGQADDREQRDQALATLGSALRAVDPAVLEETGHAPRFYLLQQHAISRLPAWLSATEPPPASTPARGMLRTSARLSQVLDGQERLFAARETQVLGSLLAARGERERGTRAALALLAGLLALALYLAALVARAHRGASSACVDLSQQVRQRRAELDQVRAQLRSAHAAQASAEQALRLVARARHASLEREAAIAAEERLRIARDMHDGIGQDVYALKLELQRFHARTRRRHPRLHGAVGQLLGLADEVMANLRSVIDDLRPDGLEHGLEAAIRSQVAKFRRRWGKACRIELRIEAPFDAAAINQETATAVFRILQEALTNIRRHANATQVCVQLAQRGDQLCMSIIDNGRGFGAAPGARAGSFGLAGMRERAGALGGMLDIDSAPGRGTALALAIPLPRVSA